MLFYFVLAAGIIATVVFLVNRVKANTLKAAVMKSVASILFIATGCAATANVIDSANISFALFAIVGLVCGLMGDVWLDLKWIYPKDDDFFTFTGFGSFLAGHLFYITGILVNFADFSKWIYLVAAVILAVVATAIMLALEKPMKVTYGKFKKITIAYGFVLFFVTFLAGALAVMYKLENMTLNLMFVGGLLFAISDIYLSGTYFGVGKRRPVDIIINHVAYYGAQFVIASSLMFL